MTPDQAFSLGAEGVVAKGWNDPYTAGDSRLDPVGVNFPRLKKQLGNLPVNADTKINGRIQRPSHRLRNSDIVDPTADLILSILKLLVDSIYIWS